MTYARLGVLLILAIVLMVPSRSSADVSVGVKADENGIREFHLAIGDFYNVPERAVTVIKKKGLTDDELAVVFFIAERAGVKPAPVIELRQLGKSWLDITVHFGLSPEIFYVPVNGDPGPPYGKAYGYFKKHPRNEWRNIVLTDVEVVDLVNLRFISRHYGIAPEDVMKMRAEGQPFVKVNKHAKEFKEKQKAEAKAKKAGKSKPRAEAGDNKGKKSK